MIQVPNIVGLRGNPGSEPVKIASLEHRMGRSLPEDYKQFLEVMDGLSVAGGLLVYGTGDLQERNVTWEVGEYAPGYLAIADTGEGEVILIKDDDLSIHIVGSGSMMPEDMRKIASSFGDWLSAGLPVAED